MRSNFTKLVGQLVTTNRTFKIDLSAHHLLNTIPFLHKSFTPSFKKEMYTLKRARMERYRSFERLWEGDLSRAGELLGDFLWKAVWVYNRWNYRNWTLPPRKLLCIWYNQNSFSHSSTWLTEMHIEMIPGVIRAMEAEYHLLVFGYVVTLRLDFGQGHS